MNAFMSTQRGPIVLIGFMGSGKTSAGRLAAQRLGLSFVDMDHVIEERLSLGAGSFAGPNVDDLSVDSDGRGKDDRDRGKESSQFHF